MAGESDADQRHRDLGLTVASAFYRHQPLTECEACHEKQALLDTWSAKEAYVDHLYEHFEGCMQEQLRKEASPLISDLVAYVKQKPTSTFGYIPTAVVRSVFMRGSRACLLVRPLA